ncbi:hypothetical protein JMY81_20065 [Brenneria goodwinii]|uniref:Uncharacterized protein n=1 Tax=Brenneria goodwinii TaxID=1109412 RepID=A0A0G4JTR9_9GAMM|nr:hypothetical protein [Brenneria goodwinii]MCG8158505.1 hypothetical protein [Brenneria goodwinii]MCG8163089.1 hypothetical protein [Brenneria goodwinii]MCG8167625.1 hypothetical protein [Brenneria goodwinii]MCG8172216.1 hypothetical protein [Brenneria goodwinii]MCG8176480.1 hypothetical protein [Brenneria goodwinii]
MSIPRPYLPLFSEKPELLALNEPAAATSHLRLMGFSQHLATGISVKQQRGQG